MNTDRKKDFSNTNQFTDQRGRPSSLKKLLALSLIRVNPCPSVVERFFHCIDADQD
jgi:hypothetical protein